MLTTPLARYLFLHTNRLAPYFTCRKKSSRSHSCGRERSSRRFPSLTACCQPAPQASARASGVPYLSAPPHTGQAGAAAAGGLWKAGGTARFREVSAGLGAEQGQGRRRLLRGAPAPAKMGWGEAARRLALSAIDWWRLRGRGRAGRGGPFCGRAGRRGRTPVAAAAPAERRVRCGVGAGDSWLPAPGLCAGAMVPLVGAKLLPRRGGSPLLSLLLLLLLCPGGGCLVRRRPAGPPVVLGKSPGGGGGTWPSRRCVRLAPGDLVVPAASAVVSHLLPRQGGGGRPGAGRVPPPCAARGLPGVWPSAPVAAGGAGAGYGASSP